MVKNDLALVVMDNCKELGIEVDNVLKKLRNSSNSFIIPISETRFNNGEGKIIIKETVRGKEVFILSDVGNYSSTYKMFGHDNIMGPDEHFQDIKRVISACGGNASRIRVVMPLLYAARQHRRKGRESLDCAIALQELERLGVNTIITFDVHDPNVQNAIPCLSFENFYPTLVMLEEFLNKEVIHQENLLIIAPDGGAVDRARYYADILSCDVGMFYKRRDVSVVINGKNPIISHEYIGKDVNGKDIIIVDDMISSGGTMFDLIDELKKRGANKIYIFVPFALFTEGTDRFDEYYNNKMLTKIYSTNLSYIPLKTKKKKWLVTVNCSNYLAQIVNTLNQDESVSPLMNGKENIINKLRK